jgi:hypothetical protein
MHTLSIDDKQIEINFGEDHEAIKERIEIIMVMASMLGYRISTGEVYCDWYMTFKKPNQIEYTFNWFCDENNKWKYKLLTVDADDDYTTVYVSNTPICGSYDYVLTELEKLLK